MGLKTSWFNLEVVKLATLSKTKGQIGKNLWSFAILTPSVCKDACALAILLPKSMQLNCSIVPAVSQMYFHSCSEVYLPVFWMCMLMRISIIMRINVFHSMYQIPKVE